MATRASQQRMARRFHQRFRETLEASPGFQAAVRARRCHRRRHPYCDVHPRYLRALCVQWGRELGGRPPRNRRCTKRLGTRYCWNWRVEGTTRCWRHQRPGDPVV
jgi:hypothetical protein